jgi:hypothetical protein
MDNLDELRRPEWLGQQAADSGVVLMSGELDVSRDENNLTTQSTS